ncbi:Rid family detoxifying hydrolase [uncultured Psychromonas sp.]|uniref:Rid family detoxifying hydrolase n=1 Tax=uncultured Psychromonas sp. TaxID=173974 RepID=UPI0026388508|nr:Rid family detoxifying hydrolase [uncultured Psychromonas sp.]
MTNVLSTNDAPAAIGPYIQGIDLGGTVLTSGQLPINPGTGEVPDDIGAQTRQSLENVKAVIEAANLGVSDIVKMTVFVTDLNDFNIINEVYGQFFDEFKAVNYPVRSCIQVARLPKDVSIEIEATAFRSQA